MVTQNGIKFAVHLITNHFGNLVSKVCENLLKRGPLSLEKLVKFTELTKEQVKNSLLVLVQHNCVQAFTFDEGDDREGAKAITEYVALFDNIIHRLRFPKFLEIVSQELDDECVELLEGLLRDGRLTLKQMVDRASQGKENPVAMDFVQENLRKLLAVRYVERCPDPEPFVSKPVKEETTRKRGAKSAKTDVVPRQTMEQLIMEAAVLGEGIRFSLPSNTESNADGETNADGSPMIIDGTSQAESTLWRANFEEFIRRLRRKALIENVRARLDDGAAVILSAILESTKTAEKKVKMENSVPMSLDTIFTEVMKTEFGRTMTIDRVRASLIQLGCPSRMLEDSYSIDLKNVLELARNEEVESIVLKRYGKDAYRIFRLLSKAGRLLETDKIADSTFVEKKDAPKILSRLWTDNYLHMEKLALSTTKSFLLWKVNNPVLRVHVLDEMYHAALNLSLRMAFEQEKDEELLTIPKDKIVGPIQKRYKRLRNVWLLLGSSLMKLDDALMLFHDF
ncbi:hypothetical protein L6164_006055 [Bauhinia variegata]|uniref:Uncharacterized protein n=1 Tax=Bauhinia variegata TaxID=167791 RepID=A0ACB9PSI5_BAUVA|nr:hypothetical protein L6164_006055 [Bauhinia variegata]